MDANLQCLLGFQTYSCFNPRARDGREKVFIRDGQIVSVSIHAPVMDANLEISMTQMTLRFQSTRP